MTTLHEIEQAASQLSPVERQHLLLSLARGLRDAAALPPPRDFSVEQMQQWMDEDEADFKAFRAGESKA